MYSVRGARVGRQKFTFFETVLARSPRWRGLAEQMTSKYLQVFVLTTVVKGYIIYAVCVPLTHAHTQHKLCHRLHTRVSLPHTHTRTNYTYIIIYRVQYKV